MKTVIVGDIGGTNARFALASRDLSGAIQVARTKELATADFATFSECFSHYLSETTDPGQAGDACTACFAVAGPVTANDIQFTNNAWSINRESLCDQFQLQRLDIINDFAAMACSLPWLQPADTVVLQQGAAASDQNHKPKAVVGPGTGFGVAGLVPSASGWIPLSTEGGHRSFSPESETELQVYKQLCDDNGYLAVEDLLSGPGIGNIYQALCQIHQQPAEKVSPERITAAALSGESAIAQETLSFFCNVLGSVCGDAALSYGATGGLYLAGGILPQLTDFLADSAFIERFTNKGAFKRYLKKIPVSLIVRRNTALIGAAAWVLAEQEKAQPGEVTT